MTDDSDLSAVEEVVGEAEGKKSKKENKSSLISSTKKDKKKSKEKETRYATLGDDSSAEEEVDGKSPLKIKKPKPFMFGSAKKDKEKKSKDVKSDTKVSLDFEPQPESLASNANATVDSKEKKKEKKDKSRLKLVKKSKQTSHDHEDEERGEELCIFGVPLEVAAERQRCHDGVPLPMVVRLCVDHVEEHGLMLEGIYRSSGVKSKVNKLRASFNSRTCSSVNLNDYEPAVVASVLKQYLRELPEPVLTSALLSKFEQVSAYSNPQKRIEGMKQLISHLPEPNRALLNWIFVHMGHVIERERFNKMTLQNVSIVLSPTLKLSHRVLSCFFENSHILFDANSFKKYKPPIQGSTLASLPETELEIEEEIKKQESLLADLHLQISSGAASKKTEEQIWEQQRIVTQLKRKLRNAKKGTSEDESNSLTKPKFEPIEYEEDIDFSLRVPSRNDDTISLASHDIPLTTANATPMPQAAVTTQNMQPIQQTVEVSPPKSTVLNVTTTVDGMTNQGQAAIEVAPEQQQQQQPEMEHKVTVMIHRSEQITSTKGSNEHNVTVIKLEGQEPTRKPDFPLLPPPPASNKTRVIPHTSAGILKPTPASPPKPVMAAISTLQVVDDSHVKSKSLPRGLPSEIASFDQFSSVAHVPVKKVTSPIEEGDEASGNFIEDLELECLRLKLEYEELMAVRNELEQRKRSEYKEMEDLREEIATMQTLYQYRTYSVDSSESSSDDAEEKDVREEVDELTKVLSDLVRENRELEEKRLQLCQKIQDERSACINLRVHIRLEQERIQRRRMDRKQL